MLYGKWTIMYAKWQQMYVMGLWPNRIMGLQETHLWFTLIFQLKF